MTPDAPPAEPDDIDRLALALARLVAAANPPALGPPAHLRLLKALELAELFGVGKDAAYALMHSRGFPTVAIGGRYRVPAFALEAWLVMRLEARLAGDPLLDRLRASRAPRRWGRRQ